MKKYIGKLIFMFLVIAMSLFVAAFSCNSDFLKKLNNDLSTNLNKGDGSTTPKLVLAMPTDFAGNPIAAATGYVKIKNNVVYLNAKGLADRAGDLGTPNSDSRDDERGINNFRFHTDKIFEIKRSDSKVSLFFVNRAHVTTNTIAILGAGTPCNIPVTSSESSEETLSKATGGGTCRSTAIDPTTFVQESISFDHYLGTAFGNTVASEARGSMGCTTRMVVTGATELGGMGMPKKFTETTTYARPTNSDCKLAVMNSAVAGSEGEEIDDAWAASATATKEIDLYAIAVDISGKTISQFLPAADNFNIAAFNGPLNNATMKKMLDHSGYLDLSFKVKIVTSTEFAAL